MPHFFLLLFKINIVLILFGAAYFFVLRRLTHYTLNRVFLAFGILFASVYPFIDLTTFFLQQNQEAIAFVPALNRKAAEIVPTEFITVNWQLLSALFYVGVLLMAARLLMQFASLYKMHQKSRPGTVNDRDVRILDEPVSPFSFWQTIYINPALHEKEELATILAHEQVHVTQWHSLDIILAELSVVFYWFNPGVWLMKKAVKENLEFITDQKILNKGVDRKTYQYSLLQVGNLISTVQIANNFNLSDLKKRIKMMNTRRSSQLTVSRYLLLVPILLIVTLAFTITTKATNSLAPLRKLITATIPALEHASSTVIQPQLNDLRAREKTAAKVIRQNPIAQAVVETDTTVEKIVNIVIKKTDVTDLGRHLTGKVSGVKITSKVDSIVRNGIVSDGVENGARSSEPIREIRIVGQSSKLAALKIIDVRAEKDNPKESVKYLVTVNGKRISSDELSTIDPENIATVKVIEGRPNTEIHIIAKPKN